MKKKFKIILNMLKTRVAKNTIWIMIERIFQMLISLVVGALSARYLGPSNYGLINYGASIVLLFSSVAKLGLENIIIKEYIHAKDKEGEIIGTALIMRMISAFLSIIMIFGLVNILNPGEKLTHIITILQSIALLFQMYEIIDYWFQSKLKSRYVSIAKMIAYVVVAVYKIILLVTQKSVIWFALSTTLDYIVIFIVLFIMYRKESKYRLSYTSKTLKKLLSNSYHFIISGMIITLYTQMDKIMIGSYLSENEIGFYSAATTICTLWGFIPEAIINSFRPVIYSAKKENEKLYSKRLKLLYCIVFWICVVFNIFISLLSKFIIIILYGETYLPAQESLLIVLWYTTFAYLGSARSVWIVCEDKHKYSKKYVIYGAIVNLILNAILIPKIGIKGAAIATLISQMVVALIAPLIYKETRISVKYILEAIIFKGVKND